MPEEPTQIAVSCLKSRNKQSGMAFSLRLFCLTGTFFLFLAPLFGSRVYLKNGDRISGNILEESSGYVYIESPHGDFYIPGKLVQRIEYDENYHRIYLRSTDGTRVVRILFSDRVQVIFFENQKRCKMDWKAIQSIRFTGIRL